MNFHGADRLLFYQATVLSITLETVVIDLGPPAAVKSAQQGNLILSCLRRGTYLLYLERSKQQPTPVRTLGKVSCGCCRGNVSLTLRSWGCRTAREVETQALDHLKSNSVEAATLPN